eukprot:gene15149-16706_t
MPRAFLALKGRYEPHNDHVHAVKYQNMKGSIQTMDGTASGSTSVEPLIPAKAHRIWRPIQIIESDDEARSNLPIKVPYTVAEESNVSIKRPYMASEWSDASINGAGMLTEENTLADTNRKLNTIAKQESELSVKRNGLLTGYNWPICMPNVRVHDDDVAKEPIGQAFLESQPYWCYCKHYYDYHAPWKHVNPTSLLRHEIARGEHVVRYQQQYWYENHQRLVESCELSCRTRHPAGHANATARDGQGQWRESFVVDHQRNVNEADGSRSKTRPTHDNEVVEKKFKDRATDNEKNLKPHLCAICNKKFLRKSDLKKHGLMHSGRKPYKCEKCGRHFSQSSNMLTHMRRHMGIRPFKCVKCDRAFFRKVDLRRHEGRHVGKKMKRKSSNRTPVEN